MNITVGAISNIKNQKKSYILGYCVGSNIVIPVSNPDSPFNRKSPPIEYDSTVSLLLISFDESNLFCVLLSKIKLTCLNKLLVNLIPDIVKPSEILI